MQAGVLRAQEADLWRVPPGCQLHFREIDGMSLAYAEGPGDTHLLTEFGVAALQQLQSGPITIRELTHRLAEDLDVSEDDELFQAVDALLSSLWGIGLIERVYE